MRSVTDRLNLHLPPSYFTSSSSSGPYLEALDSLPFGPNDAVHLYLGVPLCEERCSFCMYYYSRTDSEGVRAASTVRDLEKMLEGAFGDPMTPVIAAMYIGGGTPSVLTVDEIERLLGAVNRHVRFEAGAQLTFEMSPRSATPEKITAVAAHGINRVSMGVQSFDELDADRPRPTTLPAVSTQPARRGSAM